ncbi:MAG: glutamate--tRNA ligase [Candidatus Spechtbacteria bacterium]|nr:glutamate--tRNA ligase [Candidatus Spechtbacteria bacterium]
MNTTKEQFVTPDQTVRVRIAPSPTGMLHVGTARTALFNYLFARHHGGVFIVRIEDTDTERSKKEYEENILKGLKLLGMDWDEGPDVGGLHGPYRQSERLKIHKQYLNQLLEQGDAFYCWHTQAELEKERAQQEAQKQPPMHICDYRKFAAIDVTDTNKEKSIIRFQNPGGSVKFYDHVRGEIEFNADLLGDFSLAKSLDLPLYNFAAVIDDSDMEITHVIRGEDHISNTPKQILIQRALKLQSPKYAHLPLLLGTDRSKLSKRHGAVSVLEYEKMGYLPEAFINFLAILGWNANDDKEIMTMKELIERFDGDNIQQSGAIFNLEKLDWMNGMYIRNMEIGELTQRCVPFLVYAGYIEESQIANRKSPHSAYASRDKQNDGLKFKIIKTGEIVNFEWLKKIIALEQERLKRLAEIGERAGFFFTDSPSYDESLLVWKNTDKITITKTLSELENFIMSLDNKIFQTAKSLEDVLMPYASAKGDKGTILWPLRVALTGQKASPGPFEVASILGKEKTLARLAYAKSLL